MKHSVWNIYNELIPYHPDNTDASCDHSTLRQVCNHSFKPSVLCQWFTTRHIANGFHSWADRQEICMRSMFRMGHLKHIPINPNQQTAAAAAPGFVKALISISLCAPGFIISWRYMQELCGILKNRVPLVWQTLNPYERRGCPCDLCHGVFAKYPARSSLQRGELYKPITRNIPGTDCI